MNWRSICCTCFHCTSPRTGWDQTAVTSSTRMNGHQVCPTSIH